MADSINELLSVREWKPAHVNKVAYGTTPIVETPPVPPVDSFGSAQPFLNYRFARVQALDGDLVVRLVNSLDTPPALTPGTLLDGEFRVANGTSEVLQLAYGAKLYIATIAGVTNGVVIWGR